MNDPSTMWLTPANLSEIEEIVRASDVVVTTAPSPLTIGLILPWAQSPRPGQIEGRPVTYLLPRLESAFEVMPEDFIATVPVGWTLEELDEHLLAYGLTLPHSRLATKHLETDDRMRLATDTPFNHSDIHSLLGFNPPHWLEGQRGTWRDWVLGMNAITAGGTIVKSGSRVTKSVAGFDVHKFIIGSRNAFLIPLTVTLRVVPIRSLELPTIIWGSQTLETEATLDHLVHRVQHSDFEAAIAVTSGDFWFADPITATIYHLVTPNLVVDRFPGDWLMGTGSRMTFPEFTPAERAAIRRAKAVLDPTDKLNPGILGFI